MSRSNRRMTRVDPSSVSRRGSRASSNAMMARLMAASDIWRPCNWTTPVAATIRVVRASTRKLPPSTDSSSSAHSTRTRAKPFSAASPRARRTKRLEKRKLGTEFIRCCIGLGETAYDVGRDKHHELGAIDQIVAFPEQRTDAGEVLEPGNAGHTVGAA